jgi:hypothetical protein
MPKLVLDLHCEWDLETGFVEPPFFIFFEFITFVGRFHYKLH